LGRIARIFLAGLLVLLPILVTLTVTVWLAQLLKAYAGPNSLIGRLIVLLGLNLVSSEVGAYFLGFLIILGCILLLGLVVETKLWPLVQTGLDTLISRIPLIGTLLFGNTSRTDDTTELFLFLTPHIISSDDDVDKLREAIREGSDLLKQMNIGPHIIPRADTIPVPTLRPPSDSAKKDSLTTMRRRPPEL